MLNFLNLSPDLYCAIIARIKFRAGCRGVRSFRACPVRGGAEGRALDGCGLNAIHNAGLYHRH